MLETQAPAIPGHVRDAVVEALCTTVAGDQAGAATCMRVLADHGDGAVFTACMMWSTAFHQLSTGQHPGPVIYPVDMDPDDELQLIEPVAVDTPQIWAGRMITAARTGDVILQYALFDAVRRRRDLPAYAGELLSMAASAALDPARG